MRRRGCISTTRTLAARRGSPLSTTSNTLQCGDMHRPNALWTSLLPVFILLSFTGQAQTPAASSQASSSLVDPRIEKLIGSISEERLQQLLQKLVSFGTRNTLSDATSTTRGIGAARQWIFDELKRSSPRLQVSFDTYTIPPRGRITREVELRNVMAILPGKSPRRIYVSGHYDSLNIGGQLGQNTR